MSKEQLVFGKFQELALDAYLDEHDGRIANTNLNGLKITNLERFRLNSSTIEGCSLSMVAEAGQTGTQFEDVDLINCSFTQRTAAQIYATRGSWRNCRLINMDLLNSSFSGTTLEACDMRSTIVENCSFANCRIDQLDLSWAEINNCLLFSSFRSPQESRVSHTSFTNCSFINQDFSGNQDFDMASFENCKFVNCSFTREHREYLDSGHRNTITTVPTLVEANKTPVNSHSNPKEDGTDIKQATQSQEPKDPPNRPGRFSSLELLD